MKWPSDLLALAKWALWMEDMRHRMLFAASPGEIFKTGGIVYAYENVAVVRIFEAALAHKYVLNQTVMYECAYPDQTGKNPKRADLAFKDGGVGQGWNYVEVKWYAKDSVVADMEKLFGIGGKTTRWMLVYRVVANSTDGPGRAPEPLRKLMTNVAGAASCTIAEQHEDDFEAFTETQTLGRCQIWLGRLNKA